MLVLFRFGRLVILKPDSKSNLYPSSYGVVSVNLVSDLLWVMFCELLLSCVLLFFLFSFFFGQNLFSLSYLCLLPSNIFYRVCVQGFKSIKLFLL